MSMSLMSCGRPLRAGLDLPPHDALGAAAADGSLAWQAHRHRLPLDELAEECGPEEMLQGVLDGTLQLWSGQSAAILTEVIQYPRARVAYLTLAGGEMAWLRALEAAIAGWAKEAGCQRMEIICARPWDQALHGYHAVGRRLQRRL